MLPDGPSCQSRTVPLTTFVAAVGVAWRAELPQGMGVSAGTSACLGRLRRVSRGGCLGTVGMGVRRVVVNAISVAERRTGRPTWEGVYYVNSGVLRQNQFFTLIICPPRKELCISFVRKEFDAWLPASTCCSGGSEWGQSRGH